MALCQPECRGPSPPERDPTTLGVAPTASRRTDAVDDGAGGLALAVRATVDEPGLEEPLAGPGRRTRPPVGLLAPPARLFDGEADAGLFDGEVDGAANGGLFDGEVDGGANGGARVGVFDGAVDGGLGMGTGNGGLDVALVDGAVDGGLGVGLVDGGLDGGLGMGLVDGGSGIGLVDGPAMGLVDAVDGGLDVGLFDGAVAANLFDGAAGAAPYAVEVDAPPDATEVDAARGPTEVDAARDAAEVDARPGQTEVEAARDATEVDSGGSLANELKALEIQLAAVRAELDRQRAVSAARKARCLELELTIAGGRRAVEHEIEYATSNLARACALAVADRDRAVARQAEAVSGREAAVRSRARMELQRDEAIRQRELAEARLDEAVAERDEARRQGDTLRGAQVTLLKQRRSERANPSPRRSTPPPVAPAATLPSSAPPKPGTARSAKTSSAGSVLEPGRAARHRRGHGHGDPTKLDVWRIRLLAVIGLLCLVPLLVWVVRSLLGT
jgi:hypothetical protein